MFNITSGDSAECLNYGSGAFFALHSFVGQCWWEWEEQLHNAHPGSCLTPHLPMSSLPPSPSFPCPAEQKDERQCAVNTPISAVGLSQCRIPHHHISLERQSTQHRARQWLKAKLKTSLLIFWHHDNLLFWSTTIWSKFTTLHTIAPFSLNWVLNANMSLFGTFLQTQRRQVLSDITRFSLRHSFLTPRLLDYTTIT